jgi:rare lipoprotein A (peptidoglycan hydrolase)
MSRLGSNHHRPWVFLAASVFACAVLLVTTSNLHVNAQPVPESMMAKQEQARQLERDIVALENRFEKAKNDWVAISQRLEELEKQVLSCEADIDGARTEIDDARRNLNVNVRALYTRGRMDDLVTLLQSSDMTDFIVKYDYMIKAVTREARLTRALQKKRESLEKRQDELIRLKREQAGLARTADTAPIEAEIASKRQQLAAVTGEIIGMELPRTQTPAPVEFDPGRVYSKPDESGFVRTGQVISGYSSWYGADFDGKPTASGELYDQYGFTCAHRTLPFGTWLRVTFRGRSVVVKVNDRGPYVNGRMLDLSRGAAEAIGLGGVQWVDCEIVVPKGS